jgi:uncharacterized protein (DUF433 family)
MERIVINPEICNGKPIIRGMRVTVQTILEYLSAGDSIDDILSAYSFLERADILACIEFAAKVIEKPAISVPLSKAA